MGNGLQAPHIEVVILPAIKHNDKDDIQAQSLSLLLSFPLKVQPKDVIKSESLIALRC